MSCLLRLKKWVRLQWLDLPPHPHTPTHRGCGCSAPYQMMVPCPAGCYGNVVALGAYLVHPTR